MSEKPIDALVEILKERDRTIQDLRTRLSKMQDDHWRKIAEKRGRKIASLASMLSRCRAKPRKGFK